MKRVLVVDDNRSGADALARILRKRGYDSQALYDGASAIEVIRKSPPDIVLTDLFMEPVDGMEVLKAARSLESPIDTFVFTAYGGIDVAVEAMRLGAVDFLTKPITAEQLLSRLQKLEGEMTIDEGEADMPGFIANSSRSVQMRQLLQHAAAVPSSVWIYGDLGVGRTYVGRSLHELRHPQGEVELFIPNLVDDQSWPAGQPVLLLNVDLLGLEAQQRLSRRLQSEPNREVISTASSKFQSKLQSGALNPDLFYRLSVIPIHVPRLQERPEDIVSLFQQQLEVFSQKLGRPAPTLGLSEKAHLRAHSWPGNIRELRNIAERSIVLGQISIPQVVEKQTQAITFGGPFSLAEHMDKVEKDILKAALREAKGDRNEAGRLLGVERNTLRYKLKKYKLL